MERTKLKIKRVEKRLTQKQVAEAIGVTVPMYSLIENGKRKGSIEQWDKIREIFNMTYEEAWNLMLG
jgi:transcriptional regulator with XRE-family HTH domain